MTPSILHIDIDSLRVDHLGCYGYPRNTSPNIDSVVSTRSARCASGASATTANGTVTTRLLERSVADDQRTWIAAPKRDQPSNR